MPESSPKEKIKKNNYGKIAIERWSVNIRNLVLQGFSKCICMANIYCFRELGCNL